MYLVTPSPASENIILRNIGVGTAEIEAEEDDDPDDINDIFKIKGNLFDFETPLDLEEPCSDIDGFCNGKELLGMVRVRNMTYFQDHKWYDELADGILKEETLMHKAKVEESWGNATPNVMKFCAWLINKTICKLQTEKAHDPYLEINNIFGRNYDTSNAQDNQGHEEHRDDPTLEPSVCKIRRFEMMYSFNADEEYIAIKESEYLNHLKDNLDAYRELLRIIREGWVVTTPNEE
ncbi:hypothetical protein Tco_0320119 [Tanacetum coccineum]